MTHSCQKQTYVKCKVLKLIGTCYKIAGSDIQTQIKNTEKSMHL